MSNPLESISIDHSEFKIAANNSKNNFLRTHFPKAAGCSKCAGSLEHDIQSHIKNNLSKQ